jgi:uncharacterized membrane protein
VTTGPASPGPPAGVLPPRVPAVDVARGLALVAMAVYHFTWDLGFYGFIGLQAGIDPAWRVFAKVIAGSFLLLVGVSLVLSSRNGLRRGAFLRRLGAVGIAAAGVTAVTAYTTPHSFIFFGILHCIAISSVLALPLLRAPLWWLALVAVLIAAAPAVLAGPAFDQPALWWLGLAPKPPPTNDYVPILPWFAAVIAGIVLARLAVERGWDAALARWSPGPLGTVLAAGGRHSLLVYLVHQPLFFGILGTAAWLGVPTRTPATASAPAEFVESCTATCFRAGSEEGFCRSTCGCVSRRLGDALVSRTLGGRLAAEDETRIRDAVQFCRAETIEKAP